MPKGVGKGANTQYGSAVGQEGTFSDAATQDRNAVMPELKNEVNNPTGATPQQLAAQNTASQQGAGGSQAAAITQGSLAAGRSRNPGEYGAAIAQSGRQSGAGLAQRALGIQTNNANLAQGKQQDAIKQISGLYGTNVSGLSKMYENANASLNTELGADKQNQENMMQDIGAAEKLATMPLGGGKAGGLAGLA